MSDALSKITAGVTSKFVKFAEQFKEEQKLIVLSGKVSAQHRKAVLAQEAAAGRSRPYTVYKQLCAGLSMANVDPEECLGYLAERFALPENEELAKHLGFTLIKNLSEFGDNFEKMLDFHTAFESSRRNSKRDSVDDDDDDDDDSLVSLADDASVGKEFENDPESAGLLKFWLSKVYTSAEWRRGIATLVRALDNDSDEDLSGIDLGSEDSTDESDANDDENSGSSGVANDDSPTQGDDAHNVGAEKANGVEAAEDDVPDRDTAFDQLIACFDPEVFAESEIEGVRQRRAALRSARLAAEEEAARVEAELERQRLEAEKKKREERASRHKHRRRRRRHRKRKRSSDAQDDDGDYDDDEPTDADGDQSTSDAPVAADAANGDAKHSDSTAESVSAATSSAGVAVSPSAADTWEQLFATGQPDAADAAVKTEKTSDDEEQKSRRRKRKRKRRRTEE